MGRVAATGLRGTALQAPERRKIDNWPFKQSAVHSSVSRLQPVRRGHAKAWTPNATGLGGTVVRCPRNRAHLVRCVDGVFHRASDTRRRRARTETLYACCAA